MPAHSLVAYGSQPPVLAAAASAIAEVLRGAGAEAWATRIDKVESLDDFDSVVFVGQIGRGGWRDDALEFIARSRRHLSHKTVAYALDVAPGAGGPQSIRRALAGVLDRYNEIRPVRLGLFQFQLPGALADLRAWTELLRPNFIDPHLESPAGIRSLLESRPLLEQVDPSRFPVVAMRELARVAPR